MMISSFVSPACFFKMTRSFFTSSFPKWTKARLNVQPFVTGAKPRDSIALTTSEIFSFHQSLETISGKSPLHRHHPAAWCAVVRIRKEFM